MTNYNLIILPGWGGSHETWQDFVDFIRKDFESVTVIDLPCFGTEPCPEDVWGVEEYTDFVEKKIKKLKLDNIVLLGHSFGGQVATNFVAKNHKIVDRLILSGAAVFRPKYTKKRMILGIIAKFGKIIFKMPFIEKFSVFARKAFYRTIGSRDYDEANGIKQEIFKKIIRQDLRHRLDKINTPTLVLWGKKDKYIHVKFAKKIHKRLPNSQLKIIKRAGHGLHIYNKKDIKKYILKFLEDAK
jgi:pimeloyl-ACP methyl ester carboxylesterase